MYSKRIEDELKRKGISAGDEVKVAHSGRTLEGVLIPRPDSGNGSTLIIKLKNGYNIGIEFDKNTSITKVGSHRQSFEFPKVELKGKRSLPKVTIMATGGTIGSKVDYETGGVYALTKSEELLYLIPELSEIADIKIEGLMSVMSEDMTYKEWQRIAAAAAEALNSGCRGVVITHGTDIMHYTAAALSFMLSGLNAPVVITGSQRSSDRGSSDAFMNLICATRLAAGSDIAEVGICMHADSSDRFCNFTRGTKVRKMHTSRRDAFRPVNNKPIARLSMGGGIEYLSDYRKMTGRKGKVRAVTGFEPKVALVKFYPNSDPDLLEYYSSKGYKGIIIEATGLGHVAVSPNDARYSWVPHIRKAIDDGLVVGVTSQCLNGRVNRYVYSNLRRVSETGAVYCEDMLPEVALVKLGWLLGNYKKDEATAMLDKNIAGEITERTEVDW